MTAEQRRCRLVVVGTALKYLTRDWERALWQVTDAHQDYITTSGEDEERELTRTKNICEEYRQYVHEANEMIRELKEMEVTE